MFAHTNQSGNINYSVYEKCLCLVPKIENFLEREKFCEIVCKKCGVVVFENNICEEKDWRSFDEIKKKHADLFVENEKQVKINVRHTIQTYFYHLQTPDYIQKNVLSLLKNTEIDKKNIDLHILTHILFEYLYNDLNFDFEKLIQKIKKDINLSKLVTNTEKYARQKLCNNTARQEEILKKILYFSRGYMTCPKDYFEMVVQKLYDNADMKFLDNIDKKYFKEMYNFQLGKTFKNNKNNVVDKEIEFFNLALYNTLCYFAKNDFEKIDNLPDFLQKIHKKNKNVF